MFGLRQMLLSLLLIVFTTLLLIFFAKNSKKSTKSKITHSNKLPKPYPIIGHLLAFIGLTGEEVFEWLSKIIATSPTSTIVMHHPFGNRDVYTGNPANVEHILKTQFPKYGKGTRHKTVFRDLFGDSMFTENGDNWKAQRQLAGLEFTHKALAKFVENVVNFEISERLIPFLADAAEKKKVIDLQNVLKRFATDNVCMVACGYDPGYVSPSMPDDKFSRAFDDSISVCHSRFYAAFPIIWKICKFLNIGSEKRLKDSVRTIRELISSLLKANRIGSNKTSSVYEESNLLARLLKDGRFNDKLVIDVVITIILAGRDTTSAALTWFFWLLHKNNHVENEILKEINTVKEHIESKTHANSTSTNTSSSVLEELKEMQYTHAALSESMRLYPPVPVDLKEAFEDDVLPDGTKIKKGMLVGYFAHAMGRSEKLWGPDWPEFRPERWLKEEIDEVTRKPKRRFVPRDQYSYPVFLAGPRICLGKEMAYLQMKSILSAVLSRFKVIPAVDDGFNPVYVPETTAKMDGAFPVKIEERSQVEPNQVK